MLSTHLLEAKHAEEHVAPDPYRPAEAEDTTDAIGEPEELREGAQAADDHVRQRPVEQPVDIVSDAVLSVLDSAVELRHYVEVVVSAIAIEQVVLDLLRHVGPRLALDEEHRLPDHALRQRCHRGLAHQPQHHCSVHRHQRAEHRALQLKRVVLDKCLHADQGGEADHFRNHPIGIANAAQPQETADHRADRHRLEVAPIGVTAPEHIGSI